MKTLTFALALALIPLSGCITPEPEGKSFCEEGCNEPENENNNPNTNQNNNPQLPVLKGAFISGHLGSYWDCPDEAFGGPDSMSDGAAPEGDCAPSEDGDGCFAPLNCETAQVTISLSNGGETDATGILVDKIELLTTDGESRATLPLSATIDTTLNESFDGTLAAGEEVILRVEFQGPYNPWDLLQPADGDADEGIRAPGGGGIIETTFSSENHADLTVESGELYDVPAIDT